MLNIARRGLLGVVLGASLQSCVLFGPGAGGGDDDSEDSQSGSNHQDSSASSVFTPPTQSSGPECYHSDSDELVLDGPLATTAGPVTLKLGILQNVTAGAEGCLDEVDFELAAGNCMLTVRAGPDADAQGNLALQYFSFDTGLNRGCPGVPAALNGIYIFDPGSGDTQLHGSIGFQGTSCKNARTPTVTAYCYDGTFEVKLDGSVEGDLQFDAAVLHLTGRICTLSTSTKACSTPAPPRM